MKFFISTGLGMEEGLKDEFTLIWPWLLDLDGRPHAQPMPELLMEKGGVTFESELHLGLQLNFHLRTAHRVLLRLAEFRCRDFPKLFQSAKKIRWQEWLTGNQPGLEISASQSRLNNEKRLRETLCDAWGLKQEAGAGKSKDIYIRVNDDLVTISLDSTGEHLHFRGLQKPIGEAPVRETLAAFCLQQLMGETPRVQLKNIELVDPMMGSGTFLSEALSLSEPHPRPFAFQNWKKCPKALTLIEFQRPWRRGSSLWAGLSGCDLDEEMVRRSREFFSTLPQILKMDSLAPELSMRDVFDVSMVAQRRRWLILNPPYGERLPWPHSAKELLAALIKVWKPEQIGVLWSESQARSAPTSIGQLQRRFSLPLQNGGIRVQFQVWSTP